ncbi:MAG TPA: glycoside hydrolase family 18 protein [Verrucomicrobiae bacterium]|nr:glycoside hydrolase family 18 protein [Verrucomicrobiae bacterium]
MRRFLLILLALVSQSPAFANDGLWTTAYYAGWMRDYLPVDQIDFSAMTHVVHFALVPRADGSLDADTNMVLASDSTQLIARAHAAGAKVLIGLGGENSAPGFRGATSESNRSTLISNLVNFVRSRGYDGVDLDWEPLEAVDMHQFIKLVVDLRGALDALPNRPLLTAAAASQPRLFAMLQSDFDQVNLMTYDFSGPWPGWLTWYNSAIYDGGHRFPGTGRPAPSVDTMVGDFLRQGITANKLGIGICFYGCVWSGGKGTSTGGAALPWQSWRTPPTVIPTAYAEIMSRYYQPQRYFWDTNAQSAYLSIDRFGSARDKFISYDDATACRAKVAYARRNGLGGVIIWELGGGYRADQPVGQRDQLLQSIKQAIAAPDRASTTSK